jgi:aspartate oxidase
MKATSGINAVEPLNGDTYEAFIQDTLKSGAGASRENLVRKLVKDSQCCLKWLIRQSEFEKGSPTLDLSVVSRCGGHSVGRTHRCPAQNGRPVPVGWKLVDTLKKRLDLLDRVQVMTNTRVLNLARSKGKSAIEVQVLRTDPELGSEHSEVIKADAVILASGGFGGQTGEYLPDGKQTLISEFAPQLLHTATTNGPWANGDGVRLGLSMGAGLRDMVLERSCYKEDKTKLVYYFNRIKFKFILLALLTLMNQLHLQNSWLLKRFVLTVVYC